MKLRPNFKLQKTEDCFKPVRLFAKLKNQLNIFFISNSKDWLQMKVTKMTSLGV